MAKSNLSILKNFLIWCSGADIELLMTCTRPVTMKYAQLGFLILIPSMFAFIAASYWLSTVFAHDQHALYIALGGGLFWSIVIFSLDRFLVMTVTKSKSILRDLFSIPVISRLTLAILIGYVVAHPLVLKMFEPNLKEMLHERNEVKAKAKAQEYDDKIKTVNAEIKALAADTDKLKDGGFNAQQCGEDPELQRLITAKQGEISTAEQEYADEVAGGPKSRTKRPKVGPVARAIQTRIDTLKQQLGDLQSRLNTALANCKSTLLTMKESADEDRMLRTTQRQQLTEQFAKKQQELASLGAEKQSALKEFNEYAAYDFLTLSNALEELGEKNPNVLFWGKLLTAVLCAVDLLALLIKMTCKQDEYDTKKQADEFFRLHEIDIRVKAHRESEELHLQNALEWQKNQATRTQLQQQAAHTMQRLKDINVSLGGLAETRNEFSEIISLLQVMGKIPANSAEFKKIIDDYQQLVSAASMRLIAEASQ